MSGQFAGHLTIIGTNPRRLYGPYRSWHCMASPEDDPLAEAVMLVQGAVAAGLKLRLLGGLGVRVLCPDFPPRLRAGQDMDLACAGKRRRDIAAYLEKSGWVPDKMV